MLKRFLRRRFAETYIAKKVSCGDLLCKKRFLRRRLYAEGEARRYCTIHIMLVLEEIIIIMILLCYNLIKLEKTV